MEINSQNKQDHEILKSTKQLNKTISDIYLQSESIQFPLANVSKILNVKIVGKQTMDLISYYLLEYQLNIKINQNHPAKNHQNNQNQIKLLWQTSFGVQCNGLIVKERKKINDMLAENNIKTLPYIDPKYADHKECLLEKLQTYHKQWVIFKGNYSFQRIQKAVGKAIIGSKTYFLLKMKHSGKRQAKWLSSIIISSILHRKYGLIIQGYKNVTRGSFVQPGYQMHLKKLQQIQKNQNFLWNNHKQKNQKFMDTQGLLKKEKMKLKKLEKRSKPLNNVDNQKKQENTNGKIENQKEKTINQRRYPIRQRHSRIQPIQPIILQSGTDNDNTPEPISQEQRKDHQALNETKGQKKHTLKKQLGKILDKHVDEQQSISSSFQLQKLNPYFTQSKSKSFVRQQQDNKIQKQNKNSQIANSKRLTRSQIRLQYQKQQKAENSPTNNRNIDKKGKKVQKSPTNKNVKKQENREQDPDIDSTQTVIEVKDSNSQEKAKSPIKSNANSSQRNKHKLQNQQQEPQSVPSYKKQSFKRKRNQQIISQTNQQLSDSDLVVKKQKRSGQRRNQKRESKQPQKKIQQQKNRFNEPNINRPKDIFNQFIKRKIYVRKVHQIKDKSQISQTPNTNDIYEQNQNSDRKKIKINQKGRTRGLSPYRTMMSNRYFEESPTPCYSQIQQPNRRPRRRNTNKNIQLSNIFPSSSQIKNIKSQTIKPAHNKNKSQKNRIKRQTTQLIKISLFKSQVQLQNQYEMVCEKTCSLDLSKMNSNLGNNNLNNLINLIEEKSPFSIHQPHKTHIPNRQLSLKIQENKCQNLYKVEYYASPFSKSEKQVDINSIVYKLPNEFWKNLRLIKLEFMLKSKLASRHPGQFIAYLENQIRSFKLKANQEENQGVFSFCNNSNNNNPQQTVVTSNKIHIVSNPQSSIRINHYPNTIPNNPTITLSTTQPHPQSSQTQPTENKNNLTASQQQFLNILSQSRQFRQHQPHQPPGLASQLTTSQLNKSQFKIKVEQTSQQQSSQQPQQQVQQINNQENKLLDHSLNPLNLNPNSSDNIKNSQNNLQNNTQNNQNQNNQNQSRPQEQSKQNSFKDSARDQLDYFSY